jgi:hypothetical protein
MEQRASGAELLLSEPEFVAWLGLEEADRRRPAPLWRVTIGVLADAPSRPTSTQDALRERST